MTLTAVLQLVHQFPPSSPKTTDITSPQLRKYFIASQNDLYQVDQFTRFILPLGGATLVLIWHWLATVSCIIGARLFSPLTRRKQALADAHPRYPDIPGPTARKRASVSESPARHGRTYASENPARHGRANASEILALHGRANGPSSPVTGFVAESASPDREPSHHHGMNGDSLRDLRRRGRPGSLKSL